MGADRTRVHPSHAYCPLVELCLKDLNLLESNTLIRMDDGFVVQPTGTYTCLTCISLVPIIITPVLNVQTLGG